MRNSKTHFLTAKSVISTMSALDYYLKYMNMYEVKIIRIIKILTVDYEKKSSSKKKT